MIFAVDALKGRCSGGNYCTGAAAPWRPYCTPTYMSRRLWWINVFTEHPALLPFFILNLVIIHGDLCHFQQFRCPQVSLKMRALILLSISSFPSCLRVSGYHLPSFQPDMVSISICLFWGRRAKEEPRQLWSNNSLPVYIPKCCGSKSDFQADWIEGIF